ncbi:MAG: hypothetical protein VW338_18630, partial [Rhodospirillaceae bacterium]
LLLNEISNANADTGANITITDAADGEVITLKSGTAITHGLTAVTETDTYGILTRHSNSLGGLQIEGLSDDTLTQALVLNGTTGDATPDATDTTTSRAAVEIHGYKTNGTTGRTTLGTGENVFAAFNGATATVLVIKDTGDLHSSDGDSTLAALDDHDDVAMLRLNELQRPRGVIETAHDEFIRAMGKERLIEVGLRGRDDPETGGRGLWNVSQNMRFLNGATWQGRLIDNAILRVAERLAEQVGIDRATVRGWMAEELADARLPQIPMFMQENA